MPEVVVSGISSRFRGVSQCEGQIAHVLLTRSPLVYSRRSLTARLACVKHAASVRPEPGSNSPLNSYDTHPQRRWTSILDVVPARDRIADKNCRNHRFLPKEPSTQQTTPKGHSPCRRVKQTNSSTFDTLLSSQGSSAHRSSNLSAWLPGQRVKTYRSRSGHAIRPFSCPALHITVDPSPWWPARGV